MELIKVGTMKNTRANASMGFSRALKYQVGVAILKKRNKPSPKKAIAKKASCTN
eukprot:CAMPEP_0172424798 /NCGR_PEP_ID=MMETSP1064-20121228/28334_1 /TAXON_ID=202472 /ORGANISM="Aulacoseira subarctica , Strain CCAP 1002/5" /LENGTH=53 /DNA_ID=CAMNT_0013167195 /DNA_START=269 /DNA_END=430 /DNA_ORIENTATION=-